MISSLVEDQRGVARGRPKRKLRKKYSWNAVAAEMEINGDDAQLELISCFQGNKVSMDSPEIYRSFS